MTDQLGNVIWRQDYYAFGGDYNTSATGNTHKFTGHVKDDATGQYYAKARYFTTGLGRWSQPEPLLKGVLPMKFLSNPQLLNPYVYCLNNPLRLVDPTGLVVEVPEKYASAVGDLYQMSKDFRDMFNKLAESDDLFKITDDELSNSRWGQTEEVGSGGNYDRQFNINLQNLDPTKSSDFQRIIETMGHEFRHGFELAYIGADNVVWIVSKDGKTKCTIEAQNLGKKILDQWKDGKLNKSIARPKAGKNYRGSSARKKLVAYKFDTGETVIVDEDPKGTVLP